MPRLPHSGVTVPHLDYTVTSLKQHNTHDGVAFVATLRHQRKIIGTIENQGSGGPTTFYPNTATYRADRAAFAQYAADSTDPHVTLPEMMIEVVADALVTEYDMTRSLAKAAKRGNTLARLIEDYADDDGKPMGWASVHATIEVPQSLASLPARLKTELSKPDLAPHELAFWQVWHADTQRWTDATDRPAHLAAQDI